MYFYIILFLPHTLLCDFNIKDISGDFGGLKFKYGDDIKANVFCGHESGG